MRSVREEIKSLAWDCAEIRVRHSILFRVSSDVWDRVWNRVRFRVWNRVRPIDWSRVDGSVAWNVKEQLKEDL